MNCGPRGSPSCYLDNNHTHDFDAFIKSVLIRSSSDLMVPFAHWIKPLKLTRNTDKTPRMSKLDVNEYLAHLTCFLEQSDILD